MLGSGAPRRHVSRSTGISCTTLRRWRLGRTPRQDDLHPERMQEEAWPAYAYLLGLYLGDGHLARMRRGVFRLDLTLDAAYPGIIREAARAVSLVRPENSVSVRRRTDAAAFIVGCYSKAWPLLLPQHGPGLKHHRRIELCRWQAEMTRRHPRCLVRGLIHSDGCRFVARQRTRGKIYHYARYEFANRSTDIINIFVTHLDSLRIDYTVRDLSDLGTASHVQIARREAVAALDAFVGPKY
jgi:hypothetical protein